MQFIILTMHDPLRLDIIRKAEKACAIDHDGTSTGRTGTSLQQLSEYPRLRMETS